MRQVGGLILFLDESNAFNRLLWRLGLEWQLGILGKTMPPGEASSFLAPLPPIILYNAITVKPTSASSPCFTTSSPSNDCDRYWFCSALLPFNLAEIGPILTKEGGPEHHGWSVD